MLQKIKSFLLTVLAIIVGIFGFSLLSRDDKGKLEKAKENIQKAGEGFEKESFNNATDAANYIDDVLSRIGRK